MIWLFGLRTSPLQAVCAVFLVWNGWFSGLCAEHRLPRRVFRCSAAERR